MSQYVLFLLLGLGAGAVYAILGLGLVLEYRSSGVINFAQGAIAMFIAYAYIDLRTTGYLMLPVVGIPSRVRVFGDGIATIPALVIALVYAAALGLLIFVLVFRPLRSSPPLARLVASVGLMIVVQAMVVLNLGDDAFNISGQTAGTILPNDPLDVLGTSVPRDRFYLAALTVAIGVALWAVFKFTTFGLATRGAAESEKGAAVCGYSSTRLGAVNWMVATALAGFAGILITPISGLNPTSFTLFIVPALGAALLGRMTSFSVTVIAGLAIGMAQSEVTKLTLEFDWLPESGLQEGLPFLAIIVALVVFGRSIPWRGTLIDRAMPVAGRPKQVLLSAVLCLAAGTLALFTLGSSLRLGLIQSLIVIVLGLSLVVVTGFAGQISLAQMAFAGFGGFMYGILSAELSVPFPLRAAAREPGHRTARLGGRVACTSNSRHPPRRAHARRRGRARCVPVQQRHLHRRRLWPPDPRGEAVRHRLQHPHLRCDGLSASPVRRPGADRRRAPRRVGGLPAQQRDRSPAARDPGERARSRRVRRQPRARQALRVSRPPASSRARRDR